MKKFSQDKNPKLDFKKAKKKPIEIKCIQINEPFQVESMEGLFTGKSGDWLMIGVNGEKYVCDDAIFQKTYDIIG